MNPRLDRRGFLVLGGLSLAAAACGGDAKPGAPAPVPVAPTDPAVAAAEAGRLAPGRKPVAVRLKAAPVTLDLAGREVQTWAYGDGAGTTEIRAKKGDLLEATLVNDLPAESTIHWHGITIRNDMDGVSPVTQAPVMPGDSFTYRFALEHPGTYWYHPHIGLQADRGLYGPLIIEDPDDATGAETEFVIVLDDWLDGLGTTPDEVLTALNPALSGHAGHAMTPDATMTPGHVMTPAPPSSAATALVSGAHGNSTPLGGMGGHIAYPLHLVNGRPPADRPTFTARAGAKIRLRIINAAAETPYRFAVGGHKLTVTHADGFPVEPVEADALVLGMGERYDVLLTPKSGAWPIMAAAEGKAGYAAAILRSSSSASAPSVGSRPTELDGRLLSYADLVPEGSARLADRAPARDYRVELIGGTDRYVWGLAGADAAALRAVEGERIRITMRNSTPMWHPMHLHGHTFAIPGGARKDTVNILPGQDLAIEFDADNPGPWMFHCHNAYHFEAGMTANLTYVRA